MLAATIVPAVSVRELAPLNVGTVELSTLVVEASTVNVPVLTTSETVTVSLSVKVALEKSPPLNSTTIPSTSIFLTLSIPVPAVSFAFEVSEAGVYLATIFDIDSST